MIEQHIDAIKNLQKLGYTTIEIAKKLNIHPPSLYNYFSDHREIFQKQRQNYRRLSEKESEDIYREFMDEGLTQASIAKKHNVAPITVHRHILKQIKKRK